MENFAHNLYLYWSVAIPVCLLIVIAICKVLLGVMNDIEKAKKQQEQDHPKVQTGVINLNNGEVTLDEEEQRR